MSQTAVLLWLSVAELQPAFRADLEQFSQSRLLRLEAPRENTPALATSGYAADVVAQVEQALEEARSATAALDPGTAFTALERVDGLLHAHAELPQAGWLMAERLELAAELEARTPEGANAARALRERAAALEGKRAEPFSDRDAVASIEPPAVHTLRVEGPAPDDVVEWDGLRQGGSSLSSAEGEHQVRVLRGGRLMWAGWVRVAPSDVTIHLPVPTITACSADDIALAHFDQNRAVAAPRARCLSYVLARPHEGGGIDVALCQRDQCSETSVWKALPAAATVEVGSRWPRWATYATASAMAVGTVLLIWRSGVFDKPEPRTDTHWVYTGTQPLARF
ncbi:MAG TPA: hypothetical protein VGI10_29070 [Polyangiaceae bacterium]|jgi:hypothetical protein